VRNGRLEFEIRRLPGVLAVDLQPEALSVLAEPSCDAVALGATLEALLASRGLPQEIRILGGMIPVSGRLHRLPALAMGGIGGIALLGVATAAALQGALPLPEFQQDHRLPPVAGAPATTTTPAGPRLRIVPGDQPAWAAAEPTLVIPANPLATTPTTGVAPRRVAAVLATTGNPVSIEPETPTTTTPTVPDVPKPVVTTPKPVVTTPKPRPKPKPPVVVTVPRPTTTHAHHECDDDDHEHGWGHWRRRTNPPGGPRLPRPCMAEGPKDR
jgi:hypothetical protein